jgi:hypothetical protein
VRRIAESPQLGSLRGELDARWSIVETAFAAEVGRGVLNYGLGVDLGTQKLTDRRRRRSVTGVREALIGFQHGRCLICAEVIGEGDRVAVDHVFPFALMERYPTNARWPQLNLDMVWNLAPAHYQCNADKSDRQPLPVELDRLVHRNEAVMFSPHPLRSTLRLTLDSAPRRFRGAREWNDFVREVQAVFS